MSETMINRPLSREEKVDTIELGTVTILEKFLDAVSRKRAECQKLYKPFDGYSARIDFEEKIRKAVVDNETSLQKGKVSVDLPNLDVYCEDSRFELVDVRPVVEDKLLDGIRQSLQTGKEFNFRAKPRGNGISIFVPNADLAIVEERINKKASKESTK